MAGIDVITKDGTTYQMMPASTAGQFSSTTAYEVGDFVYFDGVLYKCKTAHTGAFVASHFTAVTVGAELKQTGADLQSEIADVKSDLSDVTNAIFIKSDAVLHDASLESGYVYSNSLNNAYVWVWVDNYVPKGATPTINAYTFTAGDVDVVLFKKNANNTFTPKYKGTFPIVGGKTGTAITIDQSYFDDSDTYFGFHSTQNATVYNASNPKGLNCQRCLYSDVAVDTPITLSGSFPTFDLSVYISYKMEVNKISNLETEVDDLKAEVDTIKTVVTVAKDGSGKYTSVKTAVDTEPENTIIYIKPGTYTEETIDCRNKRVILIGADRNQCIIQNPNGLYANPTFWVGCGYFENLTIKAPYISGVSEEVGVTALGAYAIHCDTTDYNIDKQLEFHHCNLQSDFFPAMGVGLRKGFTLIVDDCELINNQINGRGDYSDEGSLGALYFHDASGVAGIQSIKVHDCVLKSNLKNAMTPYKAYGDSDVIVNCEFTNNVFYSAVSGLTNNIWFRNDPFNALTGNFKLVIGFGNSNADINS